VEEEAVASLQDLGLSLYEARLYLGLLRGGAQNGNELSKTAGVPSSKVYATLDKLASAGFVSYVKRGNVAEYVCVAPEELIRRLRKQFMTPLDYLEEALPNLAVRGPDPEIVTISNWDVICDNARAIIDRAVEEIHISTWDENLDELRAALIAASDRGVKVFAMIYGEGTLEVGSSQNHSYQEIVAARIGGHMLSIVVDGHEALIGHLPDHGEPSAIRTRSPVVCLMVDEYLRHDFVLQKAKAITGFDSWDRWWRSDADVRTLMLGSALASNGAPEAQPPAATPRRKRAGARSSPKS
jgi:sugar-specific transcriptional regulator TrmB